MSLRYPTLVKAAAALLALLLLLSAALLLPGSRLFSGKAAVGGPTANVPGSSAALPPTTVTTDKEGYTLWTVDWGGVSWCAPISTLRYPFNLMGQDPSVLTDASLRLTFNEGDYYHIEGVPFWKDATWGLALNGKPPVDWKLVGAIGAQPTSGKHWTTTDPVQLDPTLLIDGENNIWLQQHDNCPQEPECTTCACTCIEIKEVQLRAAIDLKIDSVSPADDTRNVWFEQSRDSEIRVKFTTVVSATTLNPDTFQVYYFDQDVNKVYVNGAVRKISDTEYAFVPDQNLMDGVQYVAQVWGKTDAEEHSRDQWVMNPRGGPLPEGRLWVFWTIPQLQVKLVPVQVLENAPLVQDKPALLRTFLRWDPKPNVFWKSQAAKVEVDDVTLDWISSGGSDIGTANWRTIADWKPVRDADTAKRKREYQVYTTNDESYTNREKWRSLDSINFSGFTPRSSGAYHFISRVTVKDSRGRLHPFTAFTDVSAASVPKLGVFIRAMAVGVDYHKTGTIDLSAVIDENLTGLLELYPIASVNQPAAPSAMQYFTPTTTLWIYNWATEPAGGYPKQYLLQELSRACSWTTGCRVMVGITSNGWLVDPGITLPEMAPYGVLIRKDDVGSNHYVMAHEIGHLAGFEHIEIPAGEGYDVYTGVDKRYSVDNDMFDFMTIDPIESAGKYLWMSDLHYPLLSTWIGTPPPSEADAGHGVSTEPRLLVSGAITETTGDVRLQPWYQMEPGDWQAPAAGPYNLVFLDAGDQEIPGYTRSFAASGNLQPAEAQPTAAGDPGLFSFAVPYPAAAAKVQIRRAADHAVLAEVLVSPSAPALSIDPPGSPVWHGAQPITWQSDPGTRYSIMEVSTDNGATWKLLAMDLTGNTFTIQTEALANTIQAQVRVTASDGLRTTTVSAGPFTVDNPPLVGYVSPSAGKTGIGINARLSAGFRDAMDPATINESSFTLASGASITVTGGVTYEAATRIATFTPQTPLAYATLYTATLTTAIHDISGEALPVAMVWSFTTEADRMPPQPVILTPADGALDVPRSRTLVVGWDQALNASTVNPSTFTLAAADGSPVSGAVTYHDTTHTATFTPDADLAPETLYVASLKGGIEDGDGNATQGDYNWAFITGQETVNPFGLTNSFVDYGVDANRDGLYEKLVIKVGIQITTTGTYTLGGTLADSNGAQITWTGAGGILTPGGQFLDLVFDGATIGGHGLDGPYTLTELMFYQTDGTSAQTMLASVTRQNAYRTFAYTAGQFPAPLLFTGLPEVWVLPGQSLNAAFNVRDYAHHQVQSSDQLHYALVGNTELRAGVTLEPDGSIRVYPRMNWSGSTAVTVQASGTGPYSNDQAQASFRVNIGWPQQIYLPLVRNDGSTPAQAPSNWEIAFFDNFEGYWGWITSGSISFPPGGWYTWGKRDCLAYSGQNSAWPVGGGDDGQNTPCGAAYPNTLNTTMIYPASINLKYTSQADFTVKVWTNLAAGDQVCVMVTNEDVPQNQLPWAQYYGVCRSGQTSGWEDLRLDLSQVPTLGNLLGTENVHVAVRFIANESGSLPVGAYVDDAVVRLCPIGLTCEP